MSNLVFFFFNDTATTEIYTLSLHDALPICAVAAIEQSSSTTRGSNCVPEQARSSASASARLRALRYERSVVIALRSEEHTSELQSQSNLVCRLLLEKKKKEGRRRLTTLSN